MQKLLDAEKQSPTIYRERGGEGMKRGDRARASVVERKSSESAQAGGLKR